MLLPPYTVNFLGRMEMPSFHAGMKQRQRLKRLALTVTAARATSGDQETTTHPPSPASQCPSRHPPVSIQWRERQERRSSWSRGGGGAPRLKSDGRMCDLRESGALDRLAGVEVEGRCVGSDAIWRRLWGTTVAKIGIRGVEDAWEADGCSNLISFYTIIQSGPLYFFTQL